MTEHATTHGRDGDGKGREAARSSSLTSGPKPRHLPVEGIPRFDPGSLLRVTPAGDRLVVASGKGVATFSIELDGERARARQIGRATLAGPARDLLVAPDGAVFVLADAQGRSLLGRLEDNRLIELLSLDAQPTAAAALRHYIALAVPAAELMPPQLLLLGRRDGRVRWRETLATSRVRLRAGRDDELLIIEPGSRRMRRMDAAARVAPCPPGSGAPPPSAPPNHVPEGHQAQPCGCPPCGAPPHSGGGSTRPPFPRDPDDRCIPGGDGDPDGCVVTLADGTVVTVADLCRPDEPPCTARLAWPTASVTRTPHTVVATSSDGRRVAFLDGRSLGRLHEHRTGRGPATVLAARGADHIFLLDADGALAILDPTPLLPQLPAGPAGAGSVLFSGEAAALQYSTAGTHVGPRTVLIVPLLEPGQTFNGTVSEYAQNLRVQQIIESAQSYFEEVTYHDPPDHQGLTVQFQWFGVDTPTLYGGPPLTLPKPWRSYWGPAWDPGAISGTVPLPGGSFVLTFSGDEVLRLNALPSPAASFEPRQFELRFPAANYRVRLPDALPTISLGPGTVPAGAITVQGTDRNGNPFAVNVDTTVLSGTTQIDLVRSSLAAGAAPQEALADVIGEMLASAPGLGGLFDRPSVIWQDDGTETGMLHVSLSFAAGSGGSAPTVTAFSMDTLLPGLPAGSRAARFDLPGDADSLQTYLRRVVGDATVRHPEFGSDLSRSYFDFEKRPPTALVAGGELTVRVNLSTRHGRGPARIDLVNQTGLSKLGMDAPRSIVGADVSFSGSGGPKFEDLTLFDDVYTAMIDATIQSWGGDQAGAIDEINRHFNCAGAGATPQECALSLIHNILVTPIFAVDGLGAADPDVADLRGAARKKSMDDLKDGQRAQPVQSIGSSRMKIVMNVAPDSAADPDRGSSSAATLAHELGHGLLSLPDLYSGGTYRSDVEYLGGHCLMSSGAGLAHLCAYNKRIRGWLDDEATLLLDRPSADETIDRQVVLIQLEHWNPQLTAAERATLAHSLLPGMPAGTPVVAAAFLRLGGDGRQFDIIELRGRGAAFSQGIDPPRVLISNAIDPNDDTRYAETALEGAGTTAGVLELYRRKVHLLSSALRNPGDAYDFAASAEFPEVGLQAEILEAATGVGASGNFAIARLRIRWNRGPAIDLGFADSIPDWQSPDIAILKPEEIAADGSFTFPENQDPETLETFRVPGSAGQGPLDHKVAVRVRNFGDAPALNVQVELVLRLPAGGGDWANEGVVGSRLVAEIPPTIGDDAPIVDFDWPVTSSPDTHVCFRAQIGDHDVPRDDNGIALASDDTSAQNNWAQQNVFIFEAPADSPPEPVEFTYQVHNAGSYVEEVRLVPRDLGPGARVTVTPERLRIAPRSRGYFRVRAQLDEWLLTARCGRDIAFLLEVWRLDDHAEERWGAAKYVIKPRRRTETVLQGFLFPDRLRLVGHVSPDVGAQRILLHIQRPSIPSVWEQLTLGPASTFDYEMNDAFPSGEEVRATAHFEGTFDFAKSTSQPVALVWHLEG